MPQVMTARDALRGALGTFADQPREVPLAPPGWAERAEAALAGSDDELVLDCAFEIRAAHSQYRADFDIKGWLHDLRNALPLRRRAESVGETRERTRHGVN